MAARSLGSTNLCVAPLVIGTMARHGDDRQTRLEIYANALDLGLTSFDTAPLYGFGAAERQLGEALGSVPRDRVQILGKVGLRWDVGDYGEVLFEFDRPDGGRGQVRRDSRPESVRWEVECSLERLRTDYLDLVQIHQPDPLTPIDETMAALAELRREGRVRQIGVSNFSARQIAAAQRALGDVPLCSLQADYSLLRRYIEDDALPHCRREHIGVLAYSPLAAGALACQHDRPGANQSAELRRALEDVLQPVAGTHGVAPSAVALAWVMGQPGVTAAISGVSSTTQLREQAAALDVGLSDAEYTALARGFRVAAEQISTAHGGRLAPVRRLAGRILRRVGLNPANLRRGSGRW